MEEPMHQHRTRKNLNQLFKESKRHRLMKTLSPRAISQYLSILILASIRWTSNKLFRPRVHPDTSTSTSKWTMWSWSTRTVWPWTWETSITGSTISISITSRRFQARVVNSRLRHKTSQLIPSQPWLRMLDKECHRALMASQIQRSIKLPGAPQANKWVAHKM